MVVRFLKELKPAGLLFFWLSLLTGLAYPLGLTALGNGLFPSQAAGSLLLRQGAVVGSSLLGQPFVSDGYFHGRPSATAPFPWNAAASSGSNLGPSNPALAEAVRDRAIRLGPDQPGQPVPMDLATTSASGLDPHISPAGAAWQVGRVAAARGLPPPPVAGLVAGQVEAALWGFWGEPRVNVLKLNMALDALAGSQ